MAFDNTNTGALFVNKKKTNPKHSDRNGTLNVDGKEYWINGWLKESKAGEKYLSLSISPKDEQKQTQNESEDDSPPF